MGFTCRALSTAFIQKLNLIDTVSNSFSICVTAIFKPAVQHNHEREIEHPIIVFSWPNVITDLT